MEEKMKKALKEIFDKLTDEQKEKAKACKTMDELMEFIGKEGIELPDDLLDNVAGGFQIQWKKVDLQPYESTPTGRKDGSLPTPPVDENIFFC